MVSKNFVSDDLVWAKMKGYPPWPGKIMAPPPNAKPKKNHHYVFFFGSNNHAWIPDDYIELHSDKMIEKYEGKKGALFRTAVDTITKLSKGKKRGNGNISTAKEHVDKFVKSEIKTENASSDSTSVSKKIKKKLPKEVSQGKTPPPHKKPIKKRTLSPDENKSETSSTKVKTEDTDKRWKMKDLYPANILKCKLPPEPEPEPFVLKRVYVECPETPAVDLKYCSQVFKKKKIVATKKRIGFLGLGLIGIRIVKNLCHSGHKRIIVWNQTPEECKMLADKLDVKIATTPSRVIQDSHITFCCVSDPELAKNLVLGDYGLLNEIERSAGEAKGYVQMTSVDPKLSQTIGTEIRMKGGRYLEAPFCGSKTDADEGTLLIVAAGDKTLYDDCKSCLDTMSKKHMFVSAEVGTASKLNIVHNMFIGTAYAAVAESLALINQSGLISEDFFDILQSGPLNSSGLLQKVHSMATLNYVTDIPLKQMQHDLNLGLSLGHEISQCSEVLATANEVYKHCESINYGNHDVSAVFEGLRP